MKDQLLQQLGDAILAYDAGQAEKLTQQTLHDNIDPLETMDVLTRSIRIVGDKFEKDEIFLPELIAAAEAMAASTALLEEAIKEQGKSKATKGVIVIGTVFGDIHDIGKNMVATLLSAAGFTVRDCGINVQADQFIERITRENADVLALSALLTTTAGEQKKVIERLEENNIRQDFKIIVGGGGITRQFAESIGADGYDATAAGAVKLTEKLLGLEGNKLDGEERTQ